MPKKCWQGPGQKLSVYPKVHERISVYAAVNITGRIYVQVFRHPGPRTGSMRCFVAGLLQNMKRPIDFRPGRKIYLFADCHKSHSQKDIKRCFQNRVEYVFNLKGMSQFQPAELLFNIARRYFYRKQLHLKDYVDVRGVLESFILSHGRDWAKIFAKCFDNYLQFV